MNQKQDQAVTKALAELSSAFHAAMCGVKANFNLCMKTIANNPDMTARKELTDNATMLYGGCIKQLQLAEDVFKQLTARAKMTPEDIEKEKAVEELEAARDEVHRNLVFDASEGPRIITPENPRPDLPVEVVP